MAVLRECLVEFPLLKLEVLLLSHSPLLFFKKRFVFSTTDRRVEDNIFLLVTSTFVRVPEPSFFQISIPAMALETAASYHENIYEISDFSAHDTDVVGCLGVLTSCTSLPVYTDAVHIFHSKHPLFGKTKVKTMVNTVWDQFMLLIVAQLLNAV